MRRFSGYTVQPIPGSRDKTTGQSNSKADRVLPVQVKNPIFVRHTAEYITKIQSADDMAENNIGRISQAESLEKMGEFWDTHEFTAFDTDAPDVEFTISTMISIEPDLLAAVEDQARLRGIGVETLVNLWLQEKLSEQ